MTPISRSVIPPPAAAISTMVQTSASCGSSPVRASIAFSCLGERAAKPGASAAADQAYRLRSNSSTERPVTL